LFSFFEILFDISSNLTYIYLLVFFFFFYFFFFFTFFLFSTTQVDRVDHAICSTWKEIDLTATTKKSRSWRDYITLGFENGRFPTLSEMKKKKKHRSRGKKNDDEDESFTLTPVSVVVLLFIFLPSHPPLSFLFSLVSLVSLFSLINSLFLMTCVCYVYTNL